MAREQLQEHMVLGVTYRWEDQTDLFHQIVPVLDFLAPVSFVVTFVVTVVVQFIVFTRCYSPPTVEERERFSRRELQLRARRRFFDTFSSEKMTVLRRITYACWAASFLLFGSQFVFIALFGVPSTP
ncbi:MAG: hypothetical protein C0606_07225 [Hyphomicrobiales bacterium]|nr:MAG: hypothetical protein C0606_07225 [Hyphomicrobiales bacterium]